MDLKQIYKIAHMRSMLFIPEDVERCPLLNSDGGTITSMKSIRRPHFDARCLQGSHQIAQISKML